MGITLTRQVGEQYIKRYFLDVKSIHVGRDQNYSLVRNGYLIPEDDFVSGIHCVIDYDGKNFTVRDLSSRNGTYVNGTKITAARRLEDGDKLRLGKTTIEVNISEI